MNFDLTDDQIALRDGMRAVVEGRFPIERVREGFNRTVHAELAEAGVFSLRADGFSWADCAVVYEELGRGVVPGPLVWCFGRDLIAGGFDTAIGGAMLVEHFETLDEVIVLGADHATVVAASTLTGVNQDWPLDPLSPVSVVEGIETATGARHPEVIGELRLHGALLTAAFCVGMADRLTEMSVAYALERRQFDRPIGSFQAVKHICADMAVRAELARVSTHAAA